MGVFVVGGVGFQKLRLSVQLTGGGKNVLCVILGGFGRGCGCLNVRCVVLWLMIGLNTGFGHLPSLALDRRHGL